VTGRVIEPLLGAAGVGAGQAVADLATGPGYVAAGVRTRGAVPIGVDVAGAMVELARELHPGIEFIQASAADLPFDDESFDAVVGTIAESGAQPPDDLPAWPPFFRFSDDAEFARLLSDAGLDPEEVLTIAWRQSFPDSETVWEGMVGATVRTASLVTSQTDETQQRIRAAFDARIAELRTNGEVELPTSVKIASARKAAP
jgi:hypothetical protein